MKTFILQFFPLTFLLFVSCRNPTRTFDKNAWLKAGDLDSYPERAAMVDDLLNNHKLTGLNFYELINKLGEPSGSDLISIFYDIEADYSMDIDPTGGTSLIFYFDGDSTITDCKLNEWSHKNIYTFPEQHLANRYAQLIKSRRTSIKPFDISNVSTGY